MSYILDDAHPDIKSWKDYFHFKGVSAGKPGFFTGNQKFYQIVSDDGLLRPHSGSFDSSKIYYGGNAKLFQESAGFEGDQILYVGDHIYGDIAQSKATLNWRTMLIVEELHEEFKKIDSIQEILSTLRIKIEQREVLDEQTQQLRAKHRASQRRVKKNDSGPSRILKHTEKEQSDLQEALALKEKYLKTIDKEIKDILKLKDDTVHPVWGELMRTGLTHSRFADQLVNYSCIYSANATNLRFYSPFKRFTAKSQTLPHEE